MAYIVWVMIGLAIALVVGSGARRRAYRFNANGAPLAGSFGAVIGGVIGDGLPNAAAGTITITSVIGAVVGSLLFCWAVRDQVEDIEP